MRVDRTFAFVLKSLDYYHRYNTEITFRNEYKVTFTCHSNENITKHCKELQRQIN